MKTILRASAAAALLALCSAPVAAQPAAAPERLILAAGTAIPLATTEAISSKRAHQGQRVALEVTDDVQVDGRIVIRRGAPAVGEVSRVVEKGVFGKSGKLAVRALFIEIGGTRVRLDGEARDTGKSGAAPVVATAVLIGAGGTFISGTSALLPAGSPIPGRIYSDVALTLRPAPASSAGGSEP